MTESDAGQPRDTTEVPASPSASESAELASSGKPTLSYGNIYTPHAGSMIINVQRESGLQSRMIVLGPRRVRLLRFLFSRGGKIAVASALAVMFIVVIEAARVPSLMRRVSRMEHTAARLDSLERSLGQLQQRYDQVRTMMGADSNAQVGTAALPARSLTPMPAATPRIGTAVSPDMDAQGTGVAGARAAVGTETSGLEGASSTATAVADPSQPDATPAPVRRRRRHPAVDSVAAAKDSTPTPPDSGAAPSTQAEPQ